VPSKPQSLKPVGFSIFIYSVQKGRHGLPTKQFLNDLGYSQGVKNANHDWNSSNQDIQQNDSTFQSSYTNIPIQRSLVPWQNLITYAYDKDKTASISYLLTNTKERKTRTNKMFGGRVRFNDEIFDIIIVA
jgi:hypothetical protein